MKRTNAIVQLACRRANELAENASSPVIVAE